VQALETVGDVEIMVVSVLTGLTVETVEVEDPQDCFTYSVTPEFGQKLFGSKKFCALYCSQHWVCPELELIWYDRHLESAVQAFKQSCIASKSGRGVASIVVCPGAFGDVYVQTCVFVILAEDDT
jgi:hypothetical protein